MDMIKHLIRFSAPEKVSRSLFTALVRSDVEYGSSLSGVEHQSVTSCLLKASRGGPLIIFYITLT